MKRSERSKVLSLIAAAMAMGVENHVAGYKKEPTEEEKAELRAMAERKQNKAHGLVEFTYGNNSVWALNQKNADRKARNKGYIK